MAGRDSRVRSAVPALRLSTCAETRNLEWLRRMVRAFMSNHRSPPDLVDDVALVVSELATNVIRHTDSDVLSLRLAIVADRWVLDVADADDLTALDDLALPPTDAPHGRGLYIAAELMDEITTVEIDGRCFVRCTRAATHQSPET